MKLGTRRSLGVVAITASVGLGVGVSAQYQGWAIPDTAKTEKSPVVSPVPVVKHGKSLYASNCAKCHGPEGKGNGPDSDHAADLTDEFRAELNPEGVLFYKVWNGHLSDMPAFKSKFTTYDAWAVVEYLKVLRTPAPVEESRRLRIWDAALHGDEAAIEGLKVLANAGNAEDQNLLGLMYSAGEGIPKDTVLAVNWYRKAADQGLAKAQFNLGSMYDNGEGVPKDAVLAVNWYRKAADQGLAGAQFSLGSMYDHGQGIPKNAVLAVNWYRKAADQGLAKAQFNLGSMYDNGEGVPKDAVLAVNWYRKAADQGWTGAQFNLGLIYGTGQGVPRDYVLAVMWFRKAADQGDIFAQNNLGAMYASGQVGVPKDLVAAYMWKSLAAAHGLKIAQDGSYALKKLMTPAQISEAQKLIREWRPTTSR